MTGTALVPANQTKALFARAYGPGSPTIKYLLSDEVHQLLASVENPRDHLMLRIMWETGVRVGELLKLTLHSFDTSQKHVLVPTEKKHLVKRRTGAGRPPRRETPMRRVPITSELLAELAQYALASHLESASPLFRMTRQRVFQVVKEAGRRSGLSKEHGELHPHVLRHSFAVHCVLNGVPVPVLQNWLGHASVMSTMVYTRIMSVDGDVYFQRIAW